MKFYGFLLTLFFICASLMYTNEMSAIATITIAGIMIVLLFMTIITRKKVIKANINLMILFYLFFLACCISSLLNMDIFLLKSAFNFWMVYASLVIVLPNLLQEPMKIISRSYLIGILIPIIGIPLLKDGYNTVPYMGITTNPNEMGLIASMTFVILFALLLYHLLTYLQNSKVAKKRTILFLMVLNLFILYTTILTASRTSVITCAVVIVIGVFLALGNIFSNFKRYRNLVFKLMFAGMVVYLSFYIFPITETLQEKILIKFQNHSTDTLNGRGDAWAQTISDARLFGMGDEYFSENTSVTAHNTYINILGRYGWIPLFFFIVFLLKSIHLCYRYTKHKTSTRYVPLFGMIAFLILSMAESIMLNLGMLLMFALVGCASVAKKEYAQAFRPLHLPSLQKGKQRKAAVNILNQTKFKGDKNG